MKECEIRVEVHVGGDAKVEALCEEKLLTWARESEWSSVHLRTVTWL